jgi:predicted O-methyltransferase YrrM
MTDHGLLAHANLTVDMVPHLDTLSRMATGCWAIVEFGVRSGVSTWALLNGLDPDGRMVSVDIIRQDLPDRVTQDPRWTFVQGDDLHVGLPLGRADLVFIDTSHEYDHTLAELHIAAALEPKWILLHDYELTAVEDAIAGFLRRDRGYRLAMIEPSQWGLAGLRRQ